MTKKSQARPRKHVPMRTCTVCRNKTSKRELTRIVSNADEGVIVDATGKKNGRGAYLCSNPDCWNKAVTGKVLDNALKTTLTSAERDAILQQRPQGVVPQ
jgi:predicted RNA-binding protein YlxR (DUF448 family)